MGKANTRTLYGAIALLLSAILVVAINVISNETLRSVRFDLTEGGLYSLSDGTRGVLQGLDEPVKLEFFYSSKLGEEIPAYGSFAARVHELLDRYVELADGKLLLDIYEPQPFSEVEDRAVGLGLQGVPIDQSGAQVYFGLAGTNSVDDEKVIAFFQPERERFLEYDLTNFIYELANPEKPVLGVITSLPMTGDVRPPFRSGARPWAIWDQMNQFFEVRELLANTEEIDADVDVLLVIHPKNLAENTLYALDQFVIGGGKAIFMVDPHAEAERIRPNPDGAQGVRTSSDLNRLFEAWGFTVPTDKLVGDLRGAFRVQAGPRERVNAVDYIAWFGIDGERINAEDVVTGDLQRINVASVGAIEPKEGSSAQIIPLISSSPDAMLFEADKVRINEPNPVQLLADYKPGSEAKTIAARVTGPLASAFPDGPPAPAKPADGAPQTDAEKQAAAEDQADHEARAAKHLPATDGNGTLVVVADVDMLEDRFWVQVQDFFGTPTATPVADNGAFLINLIEHMSGSADLISLRSRREGSRPFVVVERMRQNAELEYRATERALRERLEDTEAKLRSLQREGTNGQGAAILTQAQQQEIEKFRADMIDIRRQLRDVQGALRQEIETLGATVKFLNIALMPLLVLAIALLMGLIRVRRRRPTVQG